MMTNQEFMNKFAKIETLLFGFAMKLTKNADDARDLLQETAYRAAKNKDRFIEGTNFKAWTSTILRNQFINNYRKKAARIRAIKTAGNKTTMFDRKTVENDAPKVIFIKEIEKVLNSLVPEQRISFLMHYQGYSYKEISEKMDVPIGTVKSRIHLARQNMKAQIQQNYSLIN